MVYTDCLDREQCIIERIDWAIIQGDISKTISERLQGSIDLNW